MNWAEQFSQRTKLMRRSTVREFLKYAGRSGMISFAGGLPDPSLLPVKELENAVQRVLATYGPAVLQYGSTEGVLELRAHIAEPFREIGAAPENVLITSGSQQALDLVARVLLDEGDTVLVQNPTYLAALSAMRPYGVTFRDVKQRSNASLIYSIPNFRNPTGESLSETQRQEVVRLACEQNVPLLEDDAYGELRYSGAPQRSLMKVCGSIKGPVIHVGTFSKTVAPGLRVGWIVADLELVDKLVQAKQAADLHASTLTQYLGLELISDPAFRSSLERIRTTYTLKRDRMLLALRKNMPPDVIWTVPEGGMFLMCSLPEGVDGRNVAQKALETDVAVVPGDEFHVEGGRNTLRLNFSFPSVEQIETGIERLARVLAA